MLETAQVSRRRALAAQRRTIRRLRARAVNAEQRAQSLRAALARARARGGGQGGGSGGGQGGGQGGGG